MSRRWQHRIATIFQRIVDTLSTRLVTLPTAKLRVPDRHTHTHCSQVPAPFCRRDELLCGTPLLPGRVHQDVDSPGRLQATDASALPLVL
eukprot:scaffold7247_cov484-Prasinococcus_capsulatus_cf.AAC.4